MNPVAGQALAAAAPKIVDGAIKIGLAASAVLLIDHLIKKNQKNRTLAQYDNNPNVRHAIELNTALNPSGSSLMKSLDGTNEEMLMATATAISNFGEVAKMYSQLGYGDLDSDLRSDLDSQEYNEFLTRVNKLGSGTVLDSPYQFQVGEIVNKRSGDKLVVKSYMTLKDEGIVRTIHGFEDNDTPIKIIKRGKLTLTYNDGSKKKLNFYEVEFKDQGFFSDTPVKGWVPETSLI